MASCTATELTMLLSPPDRALRRLYALARRAEAGGGV